MTTRRMARWLVALTAWLLSCSDVTPSSLRTTEQVSTRSDPLVVTQQAKLLPSYKSKYDFFGLAVSLSGDGQTSLIGAPLSEEDGLTRSGAVYVFKASGQQKLLAGNKQSYASFGYAVSMSADGQVALVGAYEEDNYQLSSSHGAAYVFVRTGDTWTQQAHFLSEFSYDLDSFGSAVALSADGQTALVGALGMEDEEGYHSGAAYIFVRADGGWSQQAKLFAEDRQEADSFGDAVALSADGSTALIGAFGTSDGETDNNGAAYVFTRTGTTWSQQQKLLAEDKAHGDYLGKAVALSADGQTALIGASDKSKEGLYLSGAAYVFVRAGTAWNQQQKLLPSEQGAGYAFGVAVALSASGDFALVGASHDSEKNLLGNGAAYVFTRHDAAWNQKAKLLASDKDSFAAFGIAVSLSADGLTALVGNLPQSSDGTLLNGAAYLFTLARGAPGDPCAEETDCTSGFCADGVCCATACDAGPCSACAVAAGAPTDGACVLLTGTTCDDQNACTTSDTCQAGVCTGATVVECTPSECQHGGSCEPASGACTFTNLPDGTPCATGLCTAGDCVSAGGGSSGNSGHSSAAGHGGSAGAGGSVNQGGSPGLGGVIGQGGSAGQAGHTSSPSSGASGHDKTPTSPLSDLEGGGCGCRTTGRIESSGAGALAVLALVARRRRAA